MDLQKIGKIKLLITSHISKEGKIMLNSNHASLTVAVKLKIHQNTWVFFNRLSHWHWNKSKDQINDLLLEKENFWIGTLCTVHKAVIVTRAGKISFSDARKSVLLKATSKEHCMPRNFVHFVTLRGTCVRLIVYLVLQEMKYVMERWKGNPYFASHSKLYIT